jgi:hypothetical protein
LRNFGEDVARDQDGPLRGCERAEEVPQPAHAAGVEPIRRLVEDEQLGIAGSAAARPSRCRIPSELGLDATASRRLKLDEPQHLLDAGTWKIDRLGEHAPNGKQKAQIVAYRLPS